MNSYIPGNFYFYEINEISPIKPKAILEAPVQIVILFWIWQWSLLKFVLIDTNKFIVVPSKDN